ncbi:amino acid dehydrogenase [Mycobacterium sp. WY10]|nr:amino acid dehydrogenase [Mycobacterium sp. WY10]
MVGGQRIDSGPRSAIVVGAGIVGLSTAWFLQERGVDVTVVDCAGVAAGASAGIAGWIAPGLALPLNSPGVLRQGLRALRDPTAPLHIPLTADIGRRTFFSQFLSHCQCDSWKRAIRANVALNEDCIEAFDVLIANGVDAPVTDTPITALFSSTEEADYALWRLRQLEKAGQPTDVTGLSGEALREQVPLVSPAITVGLNVNTQRVIDPRRSVDALGRAVASRGAAMHRLEITDVASSRNGVTVYSRRKVLTADAAVIATGARLSQLAARWVRVPVQAAHGYSFTVPVQRPLPSPIYLPSARAACTPHAGAMRVSGTMEFRHPHSARVPHRVEALVASVTPFLSDVRWSERSDVWVGAHAITPDGRALIGEVSPGIYVAGGHGMWGLTHGPITGRLLAEQITTGKQPEALREFDPLRRTGH